MLQAPAASLRLQERKEGVRKRNTSRNVHEQKECKHVPGVRGSGQEGEEGEEDHGSCR